MANLGTLYFGADIDLAKLKQKINEGNKDILNALKIDYDASSYQQMVNKLRQALDNETFEIKISANTQKIVQNIQNAGRGLGNVGSLSGLDNMNEKILRQQQLVNFLTAKVKELEVAWKKTGNTERKNAFLDAQNELAKERAALNNLLATRKSYNDAIKQSTKAKQNASREAKDLNDNTIRLNTTLGNGIHISTRLGSAMSSLFAIGEAKRFLGNVIEIGGQLEKQRISMGAIIGDISRANEMFENIKTLAVKSPFGVVELDQYSKQLAAYGIEQSDLFGMTKRLADISAGAGQDIGRLALALGHVKSATYLTGITLRQFSMNNIPMLKMLADYYSEVEKRAVSTAEVQKRISKRQVSYDDVIEQIKRMTDENGMFYNMQEKISESLQAKYKNLRDSFDIMYGEIAESGIGTILKKFAEGATAMSREWKQVSMVIAEAAAVFGLQRLAIMAVNYATANLNKNTIAAALSNGKLSASMINRYVQTEQITKSQLLEAVATKKVTVENAELAASYYGITKAQLEHVASTGRYMGLLGRASLATSRFTVTQLRMIATLRAGNLTAFNTGLTGLRLGLSLVGTTAKAATTAIAGILKPLAGFAVFSAVIDVFLERSRRAEEQEQRLASMAEKANEGYKNMAETREKFNVGGSADMSDDAITNAIPDMVEQLKVYSQTAKDTFNNAFAIDDEGKAIHTLQEQYEILAQALEDTTNAYSDFHKMSLMVEESMQAAAPEKNFLDKFFLSVIDLTKYVGGKGSKSGEFAIYMDLKESLEYYAEAMNEASKAEQVFLRNHLEIVSVLQNMGVADAAELTNQEILEILTEWQTVYPSKFKEFAESMEGQAKESFDRVIDKWEDLGIASITATDRMSKAGQDFYKSAKVFWGDDMTQWPTNWKDTVLLAMQEAAKGVKGFENLSEEAKNELYNIWLEPFKIKVNTDEAHQQVNNLLVELENLVGKQWVVQIGVKGVSSIEDVKAASEAYTKAVKDVQSTTARLQRFEDKSSEAYKQTLKDQQDAIARRDAAMGVLSDYKAPLPEVNDATPKSKGGGGGGGSKKDQFLEEAKERLSEYKAFLAEYKKYRDIYSKEQAINILEGLFPNLKDQGAELVDDYPKMLNKLRMSLKGTTDDRRKFLNELQKTEAETRLDREKETIKENADAMKEYISRLEEMWKLYRSLMKKSGGNRDIAQMAFNENGAIWDDTAKNLLARFNKRGQELGVMPVNFRWDMNEKDLKDSLVNAEGQVQDELVELAKEIQKIIRGNFTQFLEDSASAYSHSLTAAQKLAELERQRDELIEKRDKENDPDNIKGWDAQIAANNKEIAKQTWEAFKETEEWGRIFSNLDNVSTSALEGMLERLKEIAPTLQESAEGTKAVYEAMDKMEEAISNRNPIKAMLGSIGRMSSIRELVKNGVSDIGFRNERGTYTIGAANARRIGLAVKKSGEYTDKDIEGAERGAMTDFESDLQNVADKFKAIQDVLQPVIDLFDQLGNETLSDVFSMGGNAFGAAAQVAGGLKTLGLGNLGPYGAAAAAALSVVSSIAAMHDKSLQKEIEASKQRQKEMENVTKNLEKALERTLGGVYNTRAGENAISSLTKEIANQFLGVKDNVAKILNIDNKSAFKNYLGKATIKAVKEAEKTKTYYDAAYASLLAQYDEVQHQMQMEEDKKKSDSDKIADYKQQLTEMDDEIKHFAEDMAKSLYDIDVKSWASELGDALFEAWQKGEDGAGAFKKKATELIADVAKNIVVTKFIETAMSDVLKTVDSEMERTKGMLDAQSVEALAAQMAALGSTLPDSFNNLMDGLNEGMKKSGLMDMKELGNESGSSSLSNGIKGITEQTADLLASYVNAIRADVSVIRANYEVNLPSISSAVQRTSVLAEAQVALQTQIADNTYRSAELVASIERILVMAGKDKSFGFFMR